MDRWEPKVPDDVEVPHRQDRAEGRARRSRSPLRRDPDRRHASSRRERHSTGSRRSSRDEDYDRRQRRDSGRGQEGRGTRSDERHGGNTGLYCDRAHYMDSGDHPRHRWDHHHASPRRHGGGTAPSTSSRHRGVGSQLDARRASEQGRASRWGPSRHRRSGQPASAAGAAGSRIGAMTSSVPAPAVDPGLTTETLALWRRDLDDYFFGRRGRSRSLTGDSGVFSSGTVADFHDFLARYLAMKQARAARAGAGSAAAGAGASGRVQPVAATAASSFRRRDTIPFTLAIPGVDIESYHGIIPTACVSEFWDCMHYYEDFCQRKAFAKLTRLRATQSDLPIAAFREDIVRAVQSHQVVLVAGDTGCGKSTQVPQYLLAAGYRNIVVTQPRRISAMALARRVAYETLNEHGSEIAYQIRLLSTRTAATRVVFVTEGVLLRQMGTDPLLRRYDVVVIDEVHERHITADFLLGLLHDLLPKRPDLRVVLMSATIDTAMFARYFGHGDTTKVPVINVPGRIFPVTVDYIQLRGEDEQLAVLKAKSAGATDESLKVTHQDHDAILGEGRARALRRLAVEEGLPRDTYVQAEVAKALAREAATPLVAPPTTKPVETSGTAAFLHRAAKADAKRLKREKIEAERATKDAAASTAALKAAGAGAGAGAGASTGAGHGSSSGATAINARASSVAAAAGAGTDVELRMQAMLQPIRRRGPINPMPFVKILARIDEEVDPSEGGDVLIFVSGVGEISSISDRLVAYASTNQRWIVLPLHSGLSVDEQDRVFATPPPGVRKCIVSTNVAETSVTIDGVRFVIDSGKVNEMGYDPMSKTQALQEFWVSRASAEQRKGRAGRTGPGRCFRLYSRQAFDAFPDYSPPEIMRVPLESVVLQIKSLGVRGGNPADFPFLQPPPVDHIRAAVRHLIDLGGLAEDGGEPLTSLGHVLAALPVDVGIGKMLVLGATFGVEEVALAIAAVLSVQNPFKWTRTQDSTELLARRRFDSPDGDAFTLLNAFDEWSTVQQRRGSAGQTRGGRRGRGRGRHGSSRQWCRRHCLIEQRLYEAAKLLGQFRDLLVDSRIYDSTKRRGREVMSRPEVDRLKRERRDLDRAASGPGARKRQLTLADAWQDSSLAVGADGSEDDDDNAGDDSVARLQQVDFALTMDVAAMAAASARELTQRDVNIIKLIVMAGFYPHIAVADATNEYRKVSEQTFHTQHRQGVFLHPSSCLNAVLAGADPVGPSSADAGHRSDRRRPHVSDSHRPATKTVTLQKEVLVFSKLLQTSRPYLTGVFRVPTLACLLVARRIDAAKDFSQVLLDKWLLVVFRSPATGCRVMRIVSHLRLSMHKLLASRISQRVGSGLGHATDGSTPSRAAHATALPTTFPRSDERWTPAEATLATLPAPVREVAEARGARRGKSGRHHRRQVSDAVQLSTQVAEFVECNVNFEQQALLPLQMELLFPRSAASLALRSTGRRDDAMEALEQHADGADSGGVLLRSYLHWGSITPASRARPKDEQTDKQSA